MKLPDYLKCVEVKELLVSMGIQEVPELQSVDVTYEVHVPQEKEIENPMLSFKDRMDVKSVSLDEQGVEVRIAADDTIEINGIKACAYIKKQSNSVDLSTMTTGYRYHLCNCRTIQSMIADGRLSRYVSTTRSDGKFPVIYQSRYGAKEYILKLELCKNCKEMLQARGKLPHPYTLKKFFDEHQPNIPKTILKTEQVLVQEKYALDHPEVARRYKAREGYKCQMCDVDCSTATECIHLHHKDGDGQNNNAANLMVLCADCHSRQARHGHMLHNPNFKSEIRIIERLRREQGIVSCVKK